MSQRTSGRRSLLADVGSTLEAAVGGVGDASGLTRSGSFPHVDTTSER